MIAAGDCALQDGGLTAASYPGVTIRHPAAACTNQQWLAGCADTPICTYSIAKQCHNCFQCQDASSTVDGKMFYLLDHWPKASLLQVGLMTSLRVATNSINRQPDPGSHDARSAA
jgi:polyferredoxin